MNQLEELPAKVALWMDCEGLSLSLISAISKQNSKHISLIYAEFETSPVYSAANTLDNLGDWLKKSDFKFLGKGRTSHNQYNIIFVNNCSYQKNWLLLTSYRVFYGLFGVLHPPISILEKAFRKSFRWIKVFIKFG